jgi:thiamine biosynthesis protein ThiS
MTISGQGRFFVRLPALPSTYNNPRKVVSTENQVTVNGELRSFPPQTTLLDIVRTLNLEPERVAIELNRAIVKREMWPGTTIRSGAEIEIVQFVGGG